MNKLLKTLSTIGALGALALGATSASATTATATLPVTATVVAGCTIGSPVTMAFGNISAGTALPLNSPTNGTVSVTCTNTTPYYVSINTGANPTAGQSYMINGTQTLKYNTYVDSAHSTLWPTTAGTLGGSAPGGTGTGVAQTITFYGQIPSGITLPTPGNYTDSLTVTLTY